MKAILPNAVFIGFTGTPLLKADKKKSIEVFGGYIHTYRFDEAVKDGVGSRPALRGARHRPEYYVSNKNRSVV
jgi:type I site-specific restriction-modification system R (restriction) subunit